MKVAKYLAIAAGVGAGGVILYKYVLPRILPPPVAAAPSIVITRVWAEPSEVTLGQTVVVNVEVTNAGRAPGSSTITYEYPGYRGTLSTGTLAPGDRRVLSFSWKPEAVGKYEIVVDTNRVSVTVFSPPAAPLVVVKRMWVEPAEVPVGQTGKLCIEVKNEGNTAGSRTLKITIIGAEKYLAYLDTGSLAPGESKVLTVTFLAKYPGTQRAWVDGQFIWVTFK